jgi:predicted AAA+ superfamily ATPase
MNIDWHSTHAALWWQHKRQFRAVTALDPIELDALVGIEKQKNDL